MGHKMKNIPFAKTPVLAQLLSKIFTPYKQPKPVLVAQNQQTLDKSRELMEAVELNDSHKVDYLLNSGVSPQILTRDKRLPLIEAIERGNLHIAKILYDFGADPRSMDGIGRTAFGVAWKESYGGNHMDPSVAPEISGKAYKLFQQFTNQYGFLSRDKMFSPRYQNTHLEPGVRLVLDRDTQVFQGVHMDMNAQPIGTQELSLGRVDEVVASYPKYQKTSGQ